MASTLSGRGVGAGEFELEQGQENTEGKRNCDMAAGCKGTGGGVVQTRRIAPQGAETAPRG
jgi:hypothetical protein